MAEAVKNADFMYVTPFSLLDMCHCSPAKLSISTYLHNTHSITIDATSGTAVLALASTFLVQSLVFALPHCNLPICNQYGTLITSRRTANRV